jgi:hypothetical protein
MNYITSLAGQSSTWQGLAFFTGVLIGIFALHLGLTEAIAAGASLSAAIKIVLPDNLGDLKK